MDLQTALLRMQKPFLEAYAKLMGPAERPSSHLPDCARRTPTLLCTRAQRLSAGRAEVSWHSGDRRGNSPEPFGVLRNMMKHVSQVAFRAFVSGLILW